MTFQAAIRTGLPLTRKRKTWIYTNQYSYWAMMNPTAIFPGTFIDAEFFLNQIRLTKEDVLAKDWIVKRD